MPRAKKPPVAPVNTGHNEKIPDVAPGGAYGSRKTTEDAIHGAPLAGPSTSAMPVGPVPAVPPAGADAPPPGNDPAATLAAAQQYQPQGPELTDPTQNVNEPVTAGLASGPGAGPESLAMPDPNQQDVQAWRTHLPALEYLASMPGSTASTRNFVRRLRAAMPPSTTQQ